MQARTMARDMRRQEGEVEHIPGQEKVPLAVPSLPRSTPSYSASFVTIDWPVVGERFGVTKAEASSPLAVHGLLYPTRGAPQMHKDRVDQGTGITDGTFSSRGRFHCKRGTWRSYALRWQS